MSRKGIYSRRTADGTQAVTFGDPVLDAISSAAGTLIIGGRTIDLREGHGSPEAPSGAGPGVVVFDAPYLKFTGMVNGAERWASDDGAMVEYRVGNGRLNFHAFKKHTIVKYWSMGGKISVYNTNANFQAADIVSHYYMSVDSPCQVVKVGHDSDRNDDYVDQYEWGINAPQPERAAVLCRAQWHHEQVADAVTAGEGRPQDQQGRGAYRRSRGPVQRGEHRAAAGAGRGAVPGAMAPRTVRRRRYGGSGLPELPQRCVANGLPLRLDDDQNPDRTEWQLDGRESQE